MFSNFDRRYINFRISYKDYKVNLEITAMSASNPIHFLFQCSNSLFSRFTTLFDLLKLRTVFEILTKSINR